MRLTRQEALALLAAVAPRQEFKHELFTGVHSHPHSPYGTQGGDQTHDHAHAHEGDNTHKHPHSANVEAGDPMAVARPGSTFTRPLTDDEDLMASAMADMLPPRHSVADVPRTGWRYAIAQVGNGWQVLTADGVLNASGERGIIPLRSYVEAVDVLAQQLAAEGDSRPVLAETWSSQMSFEGVPTGDGRFIETGATTFRDCPLPLMLQTQTAPGHMTAVLAGAITSCAMAGTTAMGYGDFDASDAGKQFVALIQARSRFGVSIDVAEAEGHIVCVDPDTGAQSPDDGECEPFQVNFSMIKIMGVTGTPFPAFEGAFIELASVPVAAGALPVEDTGQLSAFAAVAVHHTPTSDAPWDGPAAVAKLPNSGGAADYKPMYAWVDPKADPDTKAAYKFPHHMTAGGAANIKACQSIIGILNGAQGGAKIPDADVKGVYSHAAAHLKDAKISPPPLMASGGLLDMDALAAVLKVEDHAHLDLFGGQEVTVTAAAEVGRALVAASSAGVLVAPSSVYFSDPTEHMADKLVRQPNGEMVCPLTVDPPGPDGWRRVYGNVAPKKLCHTGYADRCVTVPLSRTNYAAFNLRPLMCADGETVHVGHIAMGCGHADPNDPRFAHLAAVRAHYDGGPGAVHMAYVTAGQTDGLPWVSGVIAPGVTDAQLATFQAFSISGDWREVWRGKGLELIAVLGGVPVPGFPILSMAASGAEELIAAAFAAVEVWEDDDRLVALVAGGITRTQQPWESVVMGLGDRLAATEDRLDAFERRARPLWPMAASALMASMAEDDHGCDCPPDACVCELTAAAPTKQDPSITAAISTALNAIHTCIKLQMTDSDNATDPTDKKVMAALQEAATALMTAASAQGEDGAPDKVAASANGNHAH